MTLTMTMVASKASSCKKSKITTNRLLAKRNLAILGLLYLHIRLITRQYLLSDKIIFQN